MSETKLRPKNDPKNEPKDDMIVDPNISLEDQPYFHGYLPRKDIKSLLKSEGSFLVRITGDNDEQYALSVLWKNTVLHYIFERNETTQECRLEDNWFPSIPELIAYYVDEGCRITPNPGAVLLCPHEFEHWELVHEDITKTKKVDSSGQFGEVWVGKLRSRRKEEAQLVAIKIAKDKLNTDDKRRLLVEARRRRQFNHPNIVKFLGIVAKKDPLMIVFEYCEHGSLLQHVRQNANVADKNKLAVKWKLAYVLGAAKGMEYLHSMMCIHRDLAARKCLLDSQYTVKIGDFGLVREGTEYDIRDVKTAVIPWRWAAIEVMKTKRYSLKSDIWSFGVLMWEVYSDGKVPYQEMDCKSLIEFIDSGSTLEIPKGMSFGVASVMTQCFAIRPEQRPDFTEVRKILENCYKEYLNKRDRKQQNCT